MCNKEFNPNSTTQKYCKKCSVENKKINNKNAQSRYRNKENLNGALSLIEMLLANNDSTSFELDNYYSNCANLIHELDKKYDVEQNGSMLYITKKN